MSRIGVLLSGCGYLDGAEIHESVLTLLAIDRSGHEAVCFAPDIKQYHVVNHLSGEAADETRYVLTEAARIARGKIQPIEKAMVEELDALIMPGGFGAAKNLSSFAFDGKDCHVYEPVKTLIRAFYEAKKPIGAVCISPAVVAKVFEGQGVSLTIGSDAETSEALEALGQKHMDCPVTDICVDVQNKIVSVPAYMYDASIKDVAAGIERLVAEIIRMIGNRPG